LNNAARRHSQAGDPGRAAASLERALTIEPRNPWLWFRLAQVRLEQGRLEQAVSLALKSNTLAGGRPRLRADNWSLIAVIRERQGDPGAAENARRRARASAAGS